ncbi:hypothetical protein Bbelb_102550 [Branchiostoma belcheri]|nr:hypothetical protein Bbelb_102550 [Branchiostoma belcheri]
METGQTGIPHNAREWTETGRYSRYSVGGVGRRREHVWYINGSTSTATLGRHPAFNTILERPKIKCSPDTSHAEQNSTEEEEGDFALNEHGYIWDKLKTARHQRRGQFLTEAGSGDETRRVHPRRPWSGLPRYKTRKGNLRTRVVDHGALLVSLVSRLHGAQHRRVAGAVNRVAGVEASLAQTTSHQHRADRVPSTHSGAGDAACGVVIGAL